MLTGFLIGFVLASLGYVLLFFFIDYDGSLRKLIVLRFKNRFFKGGSIKEEKKHKQAIDNCLANESMFVSRGSHVSVPGVKLTSKFEDYDDGIVLHDDNFLHDKEEDEERQYNTVKAEIVVVNGVIDSIGYRNGSALKFNNRELDDCYLFVRGVTKEDEEKIGHNCPLEVNANKYRREWDKINEYTLGTLYIKKEIRTNRKSMRKFMPVQYELELKRDEKTGEFITLEE